MFNKEDFIDGDKFENLAKELGIVYTETHNLKHFFKFQNINNNSIIISHNSDGCILSKDKNFDPIPTLDNKRNVDFIWDNIPTTLKYLFSQNADIRDERIIPIPIGLERDKWFPELKKKEVIIESNRKKYIKDELLYYNVNLNNNYIRQGLYNYFKNIKWCTVENYKNGDSFENYVNNIKKHKFVLCPNGNGMDCHRTWETLYLGSIPIVQRHYFTEEFSKHIPMLIVDNIKDLSEDYLNKKYQELNNQKWDYNFLKFSYWKKMIKEKCNEN